MTAIGIVIGLSSINFPAMVFLGDSSNFALACTGNFPGGIIFPLFQAAAPIAHALL